MLADALVVEQLRDREGAERRRRARCHDQVPDPHRAAGGPLVGRHFQLIFERQPPEHARGEQWVDEAELGEYRGARPDQPPPPIDPQVSVETGAQLAGRDLRRHRRRVTQRLANQQVPRAPGFISETGEAPRPEQQHR